jgi:hypothetical protein
MPVARAALTLGGTQSLLGNLQREVCLALYRHAAAGGLLQCLLQLLAVLLWAEKGERARGAMRSGPMHA